jgi:hypothetical protein
MIKVKGKNYKFQPRRKRGRPSLLDSAADIENFMPSSETSLPSRNQVTELFLINESKIMITPIQFILKVLPSGSKHDVPR